MKKIVKIYNTIPTKNKYGYNIGYEFLIVFLYPDDNVKKFEGYCDSKNNINIKFIADCSKSDYDEIVTNHEFEVELGDSIDQILREVFSIPEMTEVYDFPLAPLSGIIGILPKTNPRN